MKLKGFNREGGNIGRIFERVWIALGVGEDGGDGSGACGGVVLLLHSFPLNFGKWTAGGA